MAKKEINKSPLKAHGLVYFKTEEAPQTKEVDSYSFEKVNQEDKIKLATDFRPFSNHFQYSIFIDNQSSAPITEVKIKIKFPEFFTFSRCYPSTINIPNVKTERNVKQINFEFNELNENSNKQIHFLFTPTSLDNTGEIRTIVTYVNNKDTIRVLDSRPTEIRVDGIIIEPKVVPSSFVSEFFLQPGIKKTIKSIGIGTINPIDRDSIFEILPHLFYIRNFQLIAKDPQKRILWFFGTESLIKEDVLVIGQIISNKIEFIASSLNHYLLISLLTQISNDFKDLLISNEIITSNDEIYDLECRNCGSIFPYFPQKNEPVVCKNCNFEQIIW